MAKEVYWEGMCKGIARMIAECGVYQHHKYLTMASGGLSQPLELPKKNVWVDVTINFKIGLPRSEGYNVIFVVVDCLSKYVHFVPLDMSISITNNLRIN